MYNINYVRISTFRQELKFRELFEDHKFRGNKHIKMQFTMIKFLLDYLNIFTFALVFILFYSIQVFYIFNFISMYLLTFEKMYCTSTLSKLFL